MKKKSSVMKPVLICVIVFVIAVIIVLLVTIPKEKSNEAAVETTETRDLTKSASDVEITECSDPGIINLFKQYYKALASGDSNTIESLYDNSGSISDASSLSDVVEEYTNLRVYEAEGLTSDEKAIFVYYEVKFFDVDEAAPGVNSYYITTSGSEPKLMVEMYTDSDIVNYLYDLSENEPVKSLMDSTDDWLETALSKDSVLNEVYNTMAQKVSEQQSELKNTK